MGRPLAPRAETLDRDVVTLAIISSFQNESYGSGLRAASFLNYTENY
jgi:hypothetical protein